MAAGRCVESTAARALVNAPEIAELTRLKVLEETGEQTIPTGCLDQPIQMRHTQRFRYLLTLPFGPSASFQRSIDTNAE